MGGAGGSVRGGCGSGRAGREEGLGISLASPWPGASRWRVFPKRVKGMGEGSGNASIPAPGDGVGMVEGGAAPGSKGRETASGRIRDYRAAKTRGGGWRWA